MISDDITISDDYCSIASSKNRVISIIVKANITRLIGKTAHP